MKLKLIFIILILFSVKTFSCICRPVNLTDEIKSKYTENIFLAKVTKQLGNSYELLPLKIWKGNIKIDMIYKIEQNTSCHSPSFTVGEYYIFFESENRISQCSSTKNYSYSSPYLINTLRRMYPTPLKTTKHHNEIEKMEYKRELAKYEKENVVMVFNGEKIDLKNKKAVFFDGKSIFSKSVFKKSHSHSNIFLMDTKMCDYDYIFYVDKKTKLRSFPSKTKQRLTKKLIKKFCR
ncbi:hypothetical protein D1816_12885 [Aquimarina sp. AD10]|uniref:hypothetical protein n=1 Tax=Aquimarina sp. AD10 TaxID=1714849 RepID=UPI000E4A3B42|nr:hypothetical protein [Aquimarina sp. AD10]AXT61203.1 hypothetical protein D1816_12885 [Aquimarina sp. AD10]RKN02180.1 hypothetical protein D7033_01720 [Aquimarina sp. AD10]